MPKSLALGELPSPFPVAEFDRILYGGEKAMDNPAGNQEGDPRSEYGAGLQGAAFRYIAMHNAQHEFETIAAGKKTQIGTVGLQCEWANFCFNALSVIECLSYAAFAVGNHYDSINFPFSTNAERRKVSPERLAKTLGQSASTGALKVLLDGVIASGQYKSFSETRNKLIHRAANGFSIVMVGPQLHHVSQRATLSGGAFDDNLAGKGLQERRFFIDKFVKDFLDAMIVDFGIRGVAL